MTVLLSIIVFTRDDAYHLGRCLGSLEDSPPPCSFEVIVVDNASSDHTDAVLGAVEGLPLRLVRLEEETSFSIGNNAGLAQAAGEVVLFLNPDTLPTGPTISACLAVVRGDPTVGLASPRLSWPDGRPQATGWYLPAPRQLVRERLGQTAREVAPADSGRTDVGWLMGCFLMGRRARLEELGGFDEDFWFHGTDLELCARVGAAGLRVVRVEDVQMVHVGHPQWSGERRRASQDALVRWLRRDHGGASADVVRAAAQLVEALRS